MKAPAFQFYAKDWLSDTALQSTSASTRGIWINALCFMWWNGRTGELIGTKTQLARMLNCTLKEFNRFLNEAEKSHFCDIVWDQDQEAKVSIISRRLKRESHERELHRNRQRRFVERGGGDPENWTAIRMQILKRDERMCAYCGRKADTVDHVIPQSQGGTEKFSNLVACCMRCNMVKNNRTPQESNMTFWKGFDTKKLQNDAINDGTMTPTSPSPVNTSINTPTPKTKERDSRKPSKDVSDLHPSKRLKLNYRTGKLEGLTEKDREYLKEQFPACNLAREIKEFESYWYARPKQRKSNWWKTLCNRLRDVQDKGGTKGRSKQQYGIVEDAGYGLRD